jgi:hypothetical protein
MKVAVFWEKHSHMLGHLASWHTVERWEPASSRLTFSYSGPLGRGRFSHPGFLALDNGAASINTFPYNAAPGGALFIGSFI